MHSVLIHNYKIPVPGVSRKILYHFGDVRLSLSAETERRRAAQSREGWNGTRRYFADAYGEPCEPREQNEQLKTALTLGKPW